MGGWLRRAQDTPWPADDNTVEAIHSSHCLEHIPAGEPRLAVMNEAWRVLVPGGIFEIRVPRFPHAAAIADPTHVSYWVRESFGYFTGETAADADYGIKLWKLKRIEQSDWEIHAWLMKPRGD